MSWVHDPTAGGGTAQETSYTWDKNSNRTSVTVDGVLASETSYNGDNSVAKVERPGKPDRVHAYNGFGWDEIAKIRVAHVAGRPIEVNVGGTPILYEPNFAREWVYALQ